MAFSHSCPILLTILGIIAVGMVITQSQQESQNKTGTQQEQEEHIAHLGISSIIHAGESWVLKVLEH